MKLLNLVFATGTLALGIHMPCKTVAVVGDSPFLNPLESQQMSGRAGRWGFDNAGNAVFMGLNERKMRRLLLGKLPHMVGNFPLNVTMVLRLLLMVNDVTCDGTNREEVTSDSLSRYVYC
jgi:superfamily II RNA helicase